MTLMFEAFLGAWPSYSNAHYLPIPMHITPGVCRANRVCLRFSKQYCSTGHILQILHIHVHCSDSSDSSDSSHWSDSSHSSYMHVSSVNEMRQSKANTPEDNSFFLKTYTHGHYCMHEQNQYYCVHEQNQVACFNQDNAFLHGW